MEEYDLTAWSKEYLPWVGAPKVKRGQITRPSVKLLIILFPQKAIQPFATWWSGLNWCQNEGYENHGDIHVKIGRTVESSKEGPSH